MRPSRPLVALLLATMLVGFAACKGAPRQRPVTAGPVDKGPGTLQTARDYLAGRWSLLSFDVFPPGKDPIALKGTGLLTYDEFGNLEIEIRTDEATARLLDMAGIPSANGVISSKGRVAVDMPARTLTYILEGQPPLGAPSGPLATNRPRYWEVQGDILTLTTKDDGGNALSVGKWQKQ
jgi:hypothetical protein